MDIEQFNKKKLLFCERCDQVTAGTFYILMFLLPVAPAFVESFFGVIIFTFIIKRSTIFFWLLNEEQRSTKSMTFTGVYSMFIQAYKPVETYLNRPIAIYTFIAFLTIFISYNPLVSLKGFFFKLLQGIYFYFLLNEAINSKKRIFYFLNTYLLGVALVVINGIVQYFYGEGFVHHYLKVEGRISSCMKHPNELAVYLVLILPLLLTFIHSWFITKKEKQQLCEKEFRFYENSYFKIIIGAIFVLLIFCLGVTYSRGGWIALVVALIFYYLKKPKILMPMLLTIGVFVIIFSIGMIKERTVNTAGDVSIFTVSGRLDYWYSAWQVLIKHPFLGIGINAYSSAVKNFDVHWKAYPHNGYLHMGVELGFLGLGPFLLIIYRLYQVSLVNFKRMKSKFLSDVLASFLAGFLGFLYHSGLETFFYSTQLGNFLWIIMGLIVAVQKIDFKHE
ncbi:MAG: O-antigen ligase family protein [Candidatus Omnitrophica bacterium]|nr:O-antigen ligase family protein [Candidatus Omnitrophota bacterium]